MNLNDETRGGLRVFSVDSGRETMRATLFFRVGQADEQLTTSGWTHLVEHSALHGWNDPRLAFNASVGLYATRFDLDGERDAVLAHLLRLMGWLAEPELDRIDHEAKVLRAETQQRPMSAIATNYEWRYGAQGPGLAAHRELGLSRVTHGELRSWVGQMFVAENGVLATDQPLPDDFEPTLPHGEPHVPALPRSVASSFPGTHWINSGLVASGRVTRSFAAGLTPEVLSRTMTEAFRQSHGVAYAPWADLERVNSQNALLACGTDITDEGRPTSGSEFMTLLDRLADEGPPQSMLDDLAVVRERAYRDPAIAPGVAWAAATAALTGSEVYTFEEAQAHAAAVTPAEVAHVVAEFRSSLVLSLPWGAEVPAGTGALRAGTTGVLEGATCHPHGSGAAYLWLSDRAVQFVGNGMLSTVYFDDLAGVVTYPDGARQLTGRDGWSVLVEPNLYRRGRAVVAAIDRSVSADLLLPQAPRDASAIPARTSLLTHVGNWFKRHARAQARAHGEMFRQESWFGKIRYVVGLASLPFFLLLLISAVASAFR
ncbi:hypothetical protein [Intrasporangium flavum]|uniref:hypothetical protein n=1 Tax=Intrasporangium flavum TaxID=1428657 RepID=UPI00096C6665|nr:hypothetical protein [Intrasporangium flavum]